MSAIALLAAVAALLVLAAAREASAAAETRRGERIVRLAGAASVPGPALFATKAAAAVAGVATAWLAVPAAPGRLAPLVAVALPIAGFWLPDAVLERERRRRRRRLVAALPDAADLLAVASAAGRSSAVALAEVGRSGSGPLAAELRVLGAEVECGRPFAAALRALRVRTRSAEVAALCAAVERSHQLGSPLADQLRRQSSALRRDQRRAIGDRAAKAAPKIQLGGIGESVGESLDLHR